MLRRWAYRLLQGVMICALPLILSVMSLQLVTSYWFVEWEYRRPSFPEDEFGLSTAARIEMAKVCVHYLAANADIGVLADLRLPDGTPAFNARELRHMADVQRVYHQLGIAGICATFVWLGMGIWLYFLDRSRQLLREALMGGSLFTFAIVVAVGTYMAVNWHAFFTDFHRLFFEGDSWLFNYSDTLIRLFPLRFWTDVAALVVGFTVGGAALVGVAGWRWGKTAPRSPAPATPAAPVNNAGDRE